MKRIDVYVVQPEGWDGARFQRALDEAYAYTHDLAPGVDLHLGESPSGVAEIQVAGYFPDMVPAVRRIVGEILAGFGLAS